MMRKVLCGVLLCFLFISFSGKTNAAGSSVILMEATTKRVLYERNIHSRNLTASIAKIATAVVAIENGDMFSMVTVTKRAAKAEGSSVYLQEGDRVLFIDLLYGLMLRSGNDCGTLLAEATFGDYDLFVLKMNELARRIGMKNSTFENPTGLDGETRNYSTAYDMAILMCYAANNEIFREICSKTLYRATTSSGIYFWSNKHRLIGRRNVLLGKTGYTKEAGRTLVSYFEKEDKRLVCVTFRIGGDFNMHDMLFSEYQSKYKFIVIIRKKVFKQGLEGYDYLPYLDHDIILPILDYEKNNLSVELHLKRVCDTDCGYIKILSEGKEIYSDFIYRYPYGVGL